MITELKDAFKKAEQLDEKQQQSIAEIINAELNWDNTFDNTQGKLSALANEAFAEYKSGKTKKQDW